MKTCADIMTPNPIWCLPTDTVQRIAEVMKQNNIGSVPVIENEQTQKLIGIITDRDLALKIIADGRDAKSTKAEAVMTRKVVTCREDDDIQVAMNGMSEHQLRRILIVDHVNKLLGIISQADVATRVDQAEKTAAVVKEISQANTQQK